jgi:hypothetical protein
VKLASLACLIATIVSTTTAQATVGGPQLVQVLGWDPKAERAYVAIRFFDDIHGGPAVYYFDLRRTRSYQPIRVRAYERVAYALVDSLAAHLRPLRHIATTSSSIVHVLERDSVDIGRPLARYRVRFFARLPMPLPFWSHEYQVDVVTYRDSTVRQLALFSIPGRKELLTVLSFIGNRVEGGYETQSPVLFGAPGAPGVLGPIRGDE